MSETRDGQRCYDTGDARPKFLESVTEHPDVQRLIKQAVLDGLKIKQLQAEIKGPKEVFKDGWSQGFEECKRLLRGENREHTIGTAVDEDGCCVSCGRDINFIAINAESKDKDIIIRNLAMLLRRLCNGSQVQKKAMDYLARKNLIGSMLKD